MTFSKVVVIILIFPLTYTGSLGEGFEPQFLGEVQNVTVVLGREAVLSCSVMKLNDYKVMWTKAGDQTILTLHKRVITHNDRIHLTHDEHNTWNLHIKDVREQDQDCYMCQINTEKMRKQIGCVTVLVPPDIDQSLSSGDVVVTEGGNTTLSCLAHGQPQPTVTWRREDRDSIKLVSGSGAVTGVPEYTGHELSLVSVKREQMGAFLCIANNNVPPAVSRRISLSVHFKPSAWVPNQLVGAPLGTDVTIECVIEAFPKAITYWQKALDNKEKIIMNGPDQRIEEERIGYRTSSKLTIKNFSKKDVGTYHCVSSNSLGSDQEVIRIYENPQVTEPNWRGNFETDRTSKIERTTEGYHSWTKSRRTSRPSQRRNTYKYVEYQPGTTKPGQVTESNADMRSFFSGSGDDNTYGTYLFLLLVNLTLLLF